MRTISTANPDGPVAVFLPSMENGGAEGVAVALINGLARRGVDIRVLLARASGDNLARIDSGIPVIGLGSGGVLAALPALVRELRQLRPAAMLSMMSHANLIAAAALALSGQRQTRLVLGERMSLAARQQFYRSAAERIVLAAMPFLYRRADTIIVPAEAMAEPLARHLRISPARIKAIGNPVVSPAMLQAAAEPWPLGEHLRANGARVVLAVGRLTAVKDYPLLFRAFSAIARQRNLHLVVLGEGEERGALEAHVNSLGMSERIHLPGHAANPFAAMAAADVFVLCSRFEGLPNVLIQALACGARVISTDCPTGPSEILENGKWGLLVPTGDAGALTCALTMALDATDWPDGRARAGHFQADQVIDSYSKLLLQGRHT